MVKAAPQHLLEVCVSGADHETIQQVMELFDRYGWGGAVVEQSHSKAEGIIDLVKTYLPAENTSALRQIEIGLALLKQAQGTSFEFNIHHLAETDWAEAWKAHYHILHIGHRLVVKPTWCAYAPQSDDLIIELDPGMAFGSGLHATTRLCMELLEQHMQPGMRILDVGTGSGILAIAAGRLGARHVLALDNDPVAVKVARQNITLNQLDATISVQAGTLETRRNHEAPSSQVAWDIIVANILAETIIELLPACWEQLAPGGILIASGIIADRTSDVLASLREQRWALVERRDDGEWVALVAQR